MNTSTLPYHQNALYSDTVIALEKLQSKNFLTDFYLAGGTSLALQLQHRKSVDLDFFIANYSSSRAILNNFAGENYTITQEARGTLDLFYHRTKVSFLEFDYPLLEPLIQLENNKYIKLASILDIACMKLNAIAGRGAKKDFFDLYFILQHYTLAEIIAAARKKFAGSNYHDSHYLRALTYFVDADADPDIDALINISWPEIKTFITDRVEEYFREQVGI